MTIAVRVLEPAEYDLVFSLAEQLHGDDPSWVAPLQAFERRRLAPTNAFFKHAEIRIFAAERDGAVVGTLSALRDSHYMAADEKVVWFGYFRAIDDQAVVDALFDAVVEQARAWGAHCIRGPRNLTRFEYVGLTVEGFHRKPPLLQDHHPRYYMERLEAAGLAKHHDVLAYEAELYQPNGTPRPMPEKLAMKARSCSIPGLTIRRAHWRTIHRDLKDAHQVLNAAYQTVPDVSPMPEETFVALGRALLLFANTELMQLAYVKGKPAAFAVCMPELNEALIHARGRLLPVGGVKFALGLRHIRSAGFKLIGVDPEYRGTGLHARLIEQVIEGCRRAGYHRLDGSVIDERNKPMRAVVEGAGCTIYRRYRFYGKEV